MNKIQSKDEEKFRSLFEGIADAVFIADPDSKKLVDCNKRAEELTGYCRKKILSMRADQLHPKDLVKRTMEDFKKHAAGKILVVETEVLAKYGKRIPVSVNASIIRFDGKRCVLGIFRDITERKLAENEIKAKSCFMENLIQQSPLPTFVMDSKGFNVMVNEAFLKFYDVPCKELVIGRNALTDPANIKQGVVRYFKEALRGKIVETPEMEFVSPYKNKKIFVRCRQFPILDPAGTVTNVVVVLEDLTERKLALKKLKEREEKYRLLAENSIDCIWMLDTDLRFTYLSPSVKRILGFEPEELVGTKLSSHFRKIEFLKVGAMAAKAVINYKTFTQVTFETKMPDNKNEEVDVEISARVLLNSQGELIGLQGTTRDITERKRAEEKEKEYRKNIELLFESAMRFVEFPQDKDIYTFIGEQLRELVGKDSYIVINSVDEEASVSTIRAVLGMGGFADKINKIFGGHLVGTTFNVEDVNQHFVDGKMHLYEGGLYGLLLKTVPKALCKSMEKLLNIKKTYTIDLAQRERFFGSIIIFFQRDDIELKDPQIIEAFTKMASIVIQRKQVEDALSESSENFQQVVSNITAVVWKADIANDGTFENTYISSVADELLGLPAGTLQNDWVKYFRYIKPEYLERVNNVFKEVIKSPGKVIGCEYEVLKDNGQTAWFYSKGRCFEKNGKLHVFGSTTDITGRKRVMEKLKESEEKYRLLADNAIDCIWQMDKETRFVYVNPAVFSMLGFTPEEWIGTVLADHCPVDDMKKTQAIMAETLKKEGDYSAIYEMNMNHKDGRVIPVEIHGKFLLDENKNPVGFCGTTRDITERKQAEDKLRELGLAIEQSPEGIGIGDMGGRFVFVNPAWAKMHGYSVADLIGKPVAMLDSPESAKNFPKVWEEIKKNGCWRGELLRAKKDGSFFPATMTSSIVVDGEGKQVGLVGTCIDITERKRAEEEINKKVEELEKFNRVTVGRELKMIELKKEINELEEKLKRKNG